MMSIDVYSIQPAKYSCNEQGKDAKLGMVSTLKTIAKNEGASALLKGLTPRVMWISIGGAVFFGAYEQAKQIISFAI